ncbi:hypothetical protein L596_028664 [Steinernema carpocapsae]|uniref:Uncharacterized protein n=1 Tax=Steinernema carpocapsae TaxID=34508 RepID=A0A4U5LZ28_STECR|nr:hypothetical protein L596_028664 [Steinernema carpocapsae]
MGSPKHLWAKISFQDPETYRGTVSRLAPSGHHIGVVVVHLVAGNRRQIELHCGTLGQILRGFVEPLLGVIALKSVRGHKSQNEEKRQRMAGVHGETELSEARKQDKCEKPTKAGRRGYTLERASRKTMSPSEEALRVRLLWLGELGGARKDFVGIQAVDSWKEVEDAGRRDEIREERGGQAMKLGFRLLKALRSERVRDCKNLFYLDELIISPRERQIVKVQVMRFVRLIIKFGVPNIINVKYNVDKNRLNVDENLADFENLTYVYISFLRICEYETVSFSSPLTLCNPVL